jgi:hypothetical protein
MKKFYKVIKENPLWEVGAILENNENGGRGYSPIDDIFLRHEVPDDFNGEYLSGYVVEDSPEYFQRVYKVDLATRVLYETKEKAMELLKKQFKEK